MERYSDTPYFGSQSEDLVGQENFFEVHSYSAFQEFPTQNRDERREERTDEGEDDVVIVNSSKKRASPKKKATPRKKATMKIEGEEEDEGGRNWLDSEVHSLIALRGEMEPEFVRNGKKQGTIFSPSPFCLGLSHGPGTLAPLSPHMGYRGISCENLLMLRQMLWVYVLEFFQGTICGQFVTVFGGMYARN
jgi:hypothetical protein